MQIRLIQLLALILAPLASTIPVSQAPSSELSTLCPFGTQYYSSSICPSGFTGCLPPSSFGLVCGAGGLRFSNDCASSAGVVPAGLDVGHWHACANGFRGCTTDGTVCDRPSIKTGAGPQAGGSGHEDTSAMPSFESNPTPGSGGAHENGLSGSETVGWRPQATDRRPGNRQPVIPTLWQWGGYPAGQRVRAYGKENRAGNIDGVGAGKM